MNNEGQENEKEQYEPEEGGLDATNLSAREVGLRRDLAQCRKEKQEYLQGWQRCQADAVNFRQEEERRRKEYALFAAEGIIRDILNVLATFHHAFTGKDDKDPYTRGFRHIYAQLEAVLQRHGVEQIMTNEEPFNALLHEAVENVPVEDAEQDNMVMEEVEKGYMLHGKVIKPAKVKVGQYKEN